MPNYEAWAHEQSVTEQVTAHGLSLLIGHTSPSVHEA